MKQRRSDRKKLPVLTRKARRSFLTLRQLAAVVIMTGLVILPSSVAFMQIFGPGMDQTPLPDYMRVDISPTSHTIPNPPLPAQACLGKLDIALVVDASGSVYQVPGATQQVLEGFANLIYLLGTEPSIRFSISKFGDFSSSRILQGMTSNKDALYTNGLNKIYTGGSPQTTDWRAGLVAGASSFNNTPSSTAKLMIVATDGDTNQPTIVGGNSSPINFAIGAANYAKNKGIHILAIGIGNVNEENLKKISGPRVGTDLNADIVKTSFSNLGKELVNYSKSLCKGAGNGPGPGNGNGNGGTGEGTNGDGRGNGGSGSGSGGGGRGDGNNGIGSGDRGEGRGNIGRGDTNSGGGSGGSSNIGSGRGDGGSGQGNSAGSGRGDTGSGTGNTGGAVPNPIPAPAPSANTTGGVRVPAPTPQSLGSQTIPPPAKPSIFFDGIEYPKGSASDNIIMANSVLIHRAWPYVSTITVVLVAIVSVGFYLWKKKHPVALQAAEMVAKTKRLTKKTKRKKKSKPAKKKK